MTKYNFQKLSMSVGALSIALGAIAVTSQSAHAAIFTELDDAGELLNTAQTVEGSGTLDLIKGTLSDLGGGTDDIDLYEIFISDTDAFSVNMNGTRLSEDNDTILWLFDADGSLVLSDDDSGVDFLSQFNAGDLSGFNADNYLLGVSLFATIPVGDPLNSWERDPFPFQTGTYKLNLTGVEFVNSTPVSTPEPASLLGLLAVGAFGANSAIKRKKAVS